MNSEYLSKEAGTSNSQGELNLLESLDKYNKEFFTLDASDVNVNTISRLVMLTLPLVTMLFIISFFHTHTHTLIDRYEDLHS